MKLPTPYYERGDVTIYHADCLELLPLMEAGSVDAVITDPPYGMERFETDTKDYLATVGPALGMAWATMQLPASAFVFTSTAEIVNVANACGLPLKRVLWMYKPNDCTYPLAGWLLKSEAILWFHAGDRIGLEERKPFRHDTYVHRSVGQEGVEGHPTVKPLWVVSDLVKRVLGRVLDPFLGSGTTAVACARLGRKGIGIEIEEKYCRIAADRIDRELDQLKLPMESEPARPRAPKPGGELTLMEAAE